MSYCESVIFCGCVPKFVWKQEMSRCLQESKYAEKANLYVHDFGYELPIFCTKKLLR